MENNEIKNIRKIIFPQMKMVEERLENASFILDKADNMDTIPILFKAVDINVKILLSFKQKPIDDFQKNIKLWRHPWSILRHSCWYPCIRNWKLVPNSSPGTGYHLDNFLYDLSRFTSWHIDKT